ncbi:hypothetical protein G6F56_013048 [Rhizopus delemar]|nr:hypothetical protein G6F56_013048 [Rhizopus delemar]
MSPTKQVYPGITSPLSLEGPSERDIQLTEELEKTLTSYDVYDSEETAKLRERILKSLDEITKEFVQIICKNQGYTIEQAVAAGGKAMAYGSYRLGVNAKDADIDVLCVFPKNVKRDDFFDVMASLLEKNQEVTELTF